MAAERARVPIFELPVICVPGERLPLHVFEPRYQRLLEHCLEREAAFGVLLCEQGDCSDVGCTARVVEVLERHPDGRADILAVGERPFGVAERVGELEYPAAEVRYLDDAGTTPPAELAEQAREAFAALAEKATGERPDEAEIDELSAYGLAARVELPPRTKLALLEKRSEAERLRSLVGALRKLDRMLARTRAIAERARGNGHVRRR